MVDQKLVSTAAVSDAISSVRNAECDWIVVGFVSETSTELEVVGKGVGGVDALRHFLESGRARFALLRSIHQQSGLPQTKFTLVSWMPYDLRPLRKAKLSTLRGQLLEVLGPIHVSVDWSEPGDISAADVDDRIARASGTRVNVTSKEAAKAAYQRTAATAARVSTQRMQQPSVPKANTADAVSFVDALADAIKDVRSDSSAVSWVVASHETPNLIGNVHSGVGGVVELLEAMDDAVVNYGLVRVVVLKDASALVKFVFVALMPSSVSAVQRARHATHRGLVLAQFQPFHVEFVIGSTAELSHELVVDRIEDTTNMRSRVRPNTVKVAVVKAPDAAKRFVDPSKQNLHDDARLQFVDEDEVVSAVAAVHRDADDTVWALVAVTEALQLQLVATGRTGLAEEMMAARKDDTGVNVGLLRVHDKIDGHDTVKFALVVLQPEDVRPMLRARISTLLGAIKKVFEPFHVDLFVTSPNEVSDAVVYDRVADASGSRSKVRQVVADDILQ